MYIKKDYYRYEHKIKTKNLKITQQKLIGFELFSITATEKKINKENLYTTHTFKSTVSMTVNNNDKCAPLLFFPTAYCSYIFLLLI